MNSRSKLIIFVSIIIVSATVLTALLFAYVSSTPGERGVDVESEIVCLTHSECGPTGFCSGTGEQARCANFVCNASGPYDDTICAENAIDGFAHCTSNGICQGGARGHLPPQQMCTVHQDCDTGFCGDNGSGSMVCLTLSCADNGPYDDTVCAASSVDGSGYCDSGAVCKGGARAEQRPPNCTSHTDCPTTNFCGSNGAGGMICLSLSCTDEGPYDDTVCAAGSVDGSGYCGSGGVCQGGARGEPSTSMPSPVTMYRYYNAASSVHFYTDNTAAMDRFPTYTYEREAFKVYPNSENTSAYAGNPDIVPVYRFYNADSGAHLYTADTAQRDRIVDQFGTLFTYEGVKFYVYKPTSASGIELNRYFNTETGAHFFTASTTEISSMESGRFPSFNAEGTAFRVLPL